MKESVMQGQPLYVNKALASPQAKSIQEDAKKEAQLTDDLNKTFEKDFDKQSLKRARIFSDGRMNEEAYFLIAHAHNMAFQNAGIGGWHGVFLNPNQVQKSAKRTCRNFRQYRRPNGDSVRQKTAAAI